MHQINMKAIRNNAKPPFKNVCKLGPDNEEQFMSAYHSQLKEIKGQFKDMPIEDGLQRCPCFKWYRNPIPLHQDYIPNLKS